jgi:hypothetical protein
LGIHQKPLVFVPAKSWVENGGGRRKFQKGRSALGLDLMKALGATWRREGSRRVGLLDPKK